MNSLLRTPFLTEIANGERIPETKLAYLEQRVLNNFYDFVIEKFLLEKERSQLTKAKLAQRIGRGPDQVNRWLSSPGNWTIGTVARLLVGISGEEAILDSKNMLNRSPQNMSAMTLLDDDEEGDVPILDLEAITQKPTTTRSIKISEIS